MVNPGRPSRACQTCKTRRIKCDESKPSCLNCVQTGRVCPGVPKETEVLFRVVQNPGRNNKSSKRKARDMQVAKKDALPLPDTSSCTAGLLASATFNPSVETVGTTFFFNALTAPTRHMDTDNGFMELAVPMYLATQDGSSLHLAVEALSLANLSRQPGMRHLDFQASQKYSQAVRSVSKTLVDPKKATRNATIEAILLLSSYEATTCSDDACDAWAKHVEGAVAVVVARGADQIRDGESLQLFRAVRAQTLANSIQGWKPMPEFPSSKGWCIDMDSSDAFEAAVFDQNYRLASLLAKAKSALFLERNSENETELEGLLQEAFELMEAIAELQFCTPLDWRWQTVLNTCDDREITDTQKMEVWPTPYLHVYKDLTTACKINEDRLNHMLCCSVVINAAKWMFADHEGYRHDRRYLIAKSRIQTLVDDMCASVPFCWYAGDIAAGSTKRTPRQRSDSESLGGYRLIWPLFAASSMPEVPIAQRDWLRGRFASIGRHYGLEESKIIGCLSIARANDN